MLKEIIKNVKNEGISDTELLLINIENTEKVYFEVQKAKDLSDFKKIVTDLVRGKEIPDAEIINLKKVDWEDAYTSFME